MPFDLLNNSGFGQNLVQSPNWPLVQGLKPWVCSPDGVFFSLSHLCCGQNRFQENHSISNQSGERTKESSAIVTLALYNLQVSMRCDITNKRPQTKKKKYCHLGILLSPVKRSTCDAQEPAQGGNMIRQRIFITCLCFNTQQSMTASQFS